MTHSDVPQNLGEMDPRSGTAVLSWLIVPLPLLSLPLMREGVMGIVFGKKG